MSEPATPVQLDLLNPLHISTSFFSGPLDLLLDLIRKRKMDIFTVSLAEICEPYLDAIKNRSNRDFESDGEFMVIASTLILIKSRRLLPRQEEPDENAEEGINPEEELRLKLIEYMQFKEIARMLDSRELLGREMFQRPEAEELGTTIKIVFKNLSVYELANAYQSLQVKKEVRKPYELKEEGLTMEACARHVIMGLTSINSGGTAEFVRIVGEGRSKEFFILCFCAMLEIARLRLIKIVQPDELGAIYIKMLPAIYEATDNIYSVKFS